MEQRNVCNARYAGQTAGPIVAFKNLLTYMDIPLIQELRLKDVFRNWESFKNFAEKNPNAVFGIDYLKEHCKSGFDEFVSRIFYGARNIGMGLSPFDMLKPATCTNTTDNSYETTLIVKSVLVD